MTMNEDAVATEYDADLDEVEVQSRLPALEVGEYLAELFGLVHVDGDNGVFDIAQFELLEARGETANPQGSKGKISFKRDEKGMKKELADKRFASFLVAISGGVDVESKSSLIRELRKNPTGRVRIRITAEKAVKSGNAYKKYTFFPA
jgi:hypothetical protein